MSHGRVAFVLFHFGQMDRPGAAAVAAVEIVTDAKATTAGTPDAKKLATDVKSVGTLDGWLLRPAVGLGTSWKIVSWNADGLGDATMVWLKEYVSRERPAVLFLNETRRSAADVEHLLGGLAGYRATVNAHDPARWHGVAALVRDDVKFERLEARLDCKARADNRSGNPCQGRILALNLIDAKCRVVATYSPNSGSDRLRPLKNLDYRLNEWDRALFQFLEWQRAQGPTLWIGDINVAPADIDVTQPSAMVAWAGFTPQERASLGKFMASGGWVDVWRAAHPRVKQYSWHGKNGRSGMRLDNAIASSDLVARLSSSFIGPLIGGAPSDHQPVGLTLVAQTPTQTPESKPAAFGTPEAPVLVDKASS